MSQDHFHKIANNLNFLRKTSKLCDVQFLVDGETIKAHKVVLAASSPYFNAMFTVGLRETKEDVIKMQGISSEALKLLIDFIYGENININQKNVQQLLVTADMLEIEQVVYMCSRVILTELDISNAINIYSFADHHNLKQLKNAVLQFVCNNFTNVYKESNIGCLNKDQIIEILSSENLILESEFEVLEAAIIWITFNLTERQLYVYDILKQVRFPLFPLELLEKVIETCEENVLRNALIAIHIDLTEKNNSLIYSTTKPRLRKQIYALCVKNSLPHKLLGASQAESNYILKKYNHLSKEWYEIPATIKCAQIAQITSLNGNIYAIGSDCNSCYCYMYNVANNIWSRRADLMVPRCEFGLCSLNGFLYVVGGWTRGGIGQTIERYDPIANEWSVFADLPQPRSCMGIIACDGVIYIAGGSTDDVRYTKDFIHFDLEEREWTTLAPMANAKCQLSLVILNDLLYVVGGSNENGDLKCAETYSFKNKRWTQLPSMKVPRNKPILITIDGLLYVIGGSKNSYTNLYRAQCYLSSVECFDPLTNTWHECTSLPECKAATVV